MHKVANTRKQEPKSKRKRGPTKVKKGKYSKRKVEIKEPEPQQSDVNVKPNLTTKTKVDRKVNCQVKTECDVAAELSRCIFVGDTTYSKPTGAEIKVIEEQAAGLTYLSNRWGYRSGPEEQHEHFEAELNNVGDYMYCAIIQFTDPLMRTIKQNFVAYGADINEKLDSTGLEQISEKRAKKIAKFLSDYISDRRTFKILSWLGHQSLEGKHSWIFGAWVLSAKAILCLAARDLSSVETISEVWRNCLKQKFVRQ